MVSAPSLSFAPRLPRRVLALRRWADAVLITVERRGDRVTAGLHCNLSLPGGPSRPYSLTSGEGDPHLQFLVRQMPGGRVSTGLFRLEVGDPVVVDPPTGRFRLGALGPGQRLLFLATGTGVAPFLSFVRSRPDLDYTLVHGVRDPEDDFAAGLVPDHRRHLLVSGPGFTPQGPGQRRGRVTDWLAETELTVYDRAFLCGNPRMILEAVPRLMDQGLDEDSIYTETYYPWESARPSSTGVSSSSFESSAP